jgi:hypothetical protein
MKTLALCVWTACLLAALPAQAGGLFGTPVKDAALDRVRGGFTSADNSLVVSFGIQRAVYIDGTLSASTGFQVAGSGAVLPMLLVQQGIGNSASLGALDASSAATVIQNTLNNQKIQTVTAIDVTANSLQAYKSLDLQSTLGTAITASLRR